MQNVKTVATVPVPFKLEEKAPALKKAGVFLSIFPKKALFKLGLC
ncbi:hypothetical protein HMPREF9130_1101 [Peptoniphilus sp. oral taxon 375 str. F0436]|nr:hypothetical protein HMPREF9130_1101 [Peptoniphilus sp. oral taxon 375 str. F0436]